MAKSKLIIGRSKKSTVLVSKRTLQEAITRANMLVETLMESDPNDSNIGQIESAVQHMTQILKASPQQMTQDGASSISDYMDDAKLPEQARKLKNEVDMILKMHKAQRGAEQQVSYAPDTSVIEHGADQYPSGAAQSDTYQFDAGMKQNLRSIGESLHASKKQGNGAAFTTDRDEKGEAKAPEKLEVPRVAKKKKEAVPDPAAAAPVAPAKPIPAAGGNPIDYIPTETLIKVIGDLPKEDDFAQNKGKQDAVVQLTEILKTRPILPPEQEGGAVAPAAPAQSTAPALAEPAAIPPPVVASTKKKADLGDHAMGDSGTISNGSGASATVGQGGNTAAPEPISAHPEPQQRSQNDLGGLSLASLEDEKTADYRLQDYKVTQEGIRPSGGMPTMDEQESGSHAVTFPEQPEPTPTPMQASLIKQAVTPPGISEELMHKLKKEYPGDKSKAYATAWSIHNKKESALKTIAAEIEKFAAASVGGWSTSYKPMEVEEDGGRTPEIAEAHAGLEDHTGINHPATTAPITLNKQAAELTTSKAVKQSESVGNDLKKMYLDAKPLTQVNDTRAVREAVEAIFRAADMFDEATKVLNKQHQQEESEIAAAEIKTKNKKSSGGLALAAAE